MEQIEFNNACYEVLEILKYIKNEDLRKIPKEEIEILEKNANFNHDFKFIPSINIKEQNISKLAIGIIAVYFEKYTATEEQKYKIKVKRENDLKCIEQKKRELYNKDNLFKDKVKSVDEVKNENTKLIKYNEIKWYERIFSFFKKILSRYKN